MAEASIKTPDQINSIKLIKGQKDSYGWEIKAYGNDFDELMKQIENTNKALKISYGSK